MLPQALYELHLYIIILDNDLITRSSSRPNCGLSLQLDTYVWSQWLSTGNADHIKIVPRVPTKMYKEFIDLSHITLSIPSTLSNMFHTHFEKWICFLPIYPIGCFKYVGITGFVDFWDKCLEIRVYFFNLPQVGVLQKKRD